MPRAWLTPEVLPSERRCRSISFPNGSEWEAALIGALVMLSEPYRWQANGSVTPNDAADAFLETVIDFIGDAPCCTQQYWQKVFNTKTGNLLAYYRLNQPSGNIVPDWTQNFNGAFASGVTWQRPGIGDAYTAGGFDGVASYINLAGANLLGNFDGNEGSFLAWAKFTAAAAVDGQNRVVVSMGRNGSTDAILIRKVAASNTVQFLWLGNSQLSQYQASGVSADEWHQFGLTWSEAAGEIKCYLDGLLLQTLSKNDVFQGPLSSSYCNIGAVRNDPIQVWLGDIAHCAVWDTPLTPDEMLYLSEVGT